MVNPKEIIEALHGWKSEGLAYTGAEYGMASVCALELMTH